MQLSIELAIAKTEFEQRIQAGECEDCPVCGRFAKVWKRKINSGVAAWIVALYRASHSQKPESGGWIHIDEVARYLPPGMRNGVRKGTDYSIARYWGLVTPRAPQPGDDLRTSGYWRLTAEGRWFAIGAHSVSKYCYVFDDKVLKFDGEPVGIRECLGDKFSYEELWGEGVAA